MEKLNLKNVTLFCYENRPDYIDKAIESVEICKFYSDFGDIKFVTNKQIDYEHCVVDDFQISTLTDYSKFILTKLNGYVDKDFVLGCHHDGFILNPDAFDKSLFDISYCGAPWTNMNNTVGNGGFVWKSKKLLNEIDKIIPQIDFNRIHPHEDIFICFQIRKYLESVGCKWASYEIAERFSVETGGKWTGQFGFHNFQFVNPEKDGWVNPLKQI